MQGEAVLIEKEAVLIKGEAVLMKGEAVLMKGKAVTNETSHLDFLRLVEAHPQEASALEILHSPSFPPEWPDSLNSSDSSLDLPFVDASDTLSRDSPAKEYFPAEGRSLDAPAQRPLPPDATTDIKAAVPMDGTESLVDEAVAPSTAKEAGASLDAPTDLTPPSMEVVVSSPKTSPPDDRGLATAEAVAHLKGLTTSAVPAMIVDGDERESIQNSRRQRMLMEHRNRLEILVGEKSDHSLNLPEVKRLKGSGRRVAIEKDMILMEAEWLQSIPEDFKENWIVVPFPVGKRCRLSSGFSSRSSAVD